MTLWLPCGYRAETELEVKRSRFLTTLARVDSEDAARAVVAEVRRAHSGARHHCSAFIVGVPDALPIERSSDDGEPAGTAGMPMLDVLRSADVGQAVAVVARYFGGVLLGTGGLVRAYSDSVSQALAAAPRVRPVVRPLYSLTVAHADFGRVQAELLAAGVEIVDAAFGAEVRLSAAPPTDAAASELFARITRGEGLPQPVGQRLTEEPVVPAPPGGRHP